LELIVCLGINIHHFRMLESLLAAHTAFNRHLSIMNTQTDALCSAHRKEEETTYYFLWRCNPWMMVRYSILGAYFMESEDLCHI